MTGRAFICLAAMIGAILMLGMLPARAAEPGDPLEGRKIAQTWCQHCHVTESEAVSGDDLAPTFKSMANKYVATPETLRTQLLEPHPTMPNLSLTEQEIRDLISYISSLSSQ